MKIKSSVNDKLLKENIEKVNDLFSKVMWGVLGILVGYFFVAKAGWLRVDERFIIKWGLCILLLNVVNVILDKSNVSEKVRKYYLIFAMQIALVFGASDVRIGYHILYVIVPVASCIYFDKKLTTIISIVALISMNLCIVYVSADRVANVYTTYTRKRYIISNTIGYSAEFLALMLVLWLLTTRILQLMNNLIEKNKNIVDMQFKIISSFAGLIESRDDDTGHHVKRTQRFVEVILEAMDEKEIYKEEMKQLDIDIVTIAAQLHDIGKIKVSDMILNKKGKLTNEEYDIIKIHTSEGKEIIEKYLEGVEENDFIDEAKKIALSHHERWDGNGYPEGLKEKEIPLSARVMAVADVFDALVNKRCYKEAFSLEKSFSIIEEGAGTQFDPEVVSAFLSKKEEISDIYNEQRNNI